MKPLLSQSKRSTELTQPPNQNLNLDSTFGTQRERKYFIDGTVNVGSRLIVVLLRY